MAKSKVPKKAIGIGAGLAFGGVLFFLFALPLILISPEIAPQSEPEPFEIPIPLPPEVIEDVITELEEVIEDPLPFVDEQCEPYPDCLTEQIQEVIEEIVKDLPEEIPPDQSQVCPPVCGEETSTDPPLEQICDIEPENLLCQIISPSTALQLKSIVTKIDSSGLETIEENIFTFAFFVEEQTDIDFRTGFLETELIIISDPNSVIQAIGNVDVLINGQSILSSPIPIGIMGTTDQSGEITLPFLSPTGQPSNKFTFSFNEHFNTFNNNQVNKVEIKIDQLDVTKDNTEEFSMTEQTVFEIDINKDANKIIITDEESGTLRIYPTDSRLIITSKSVNVQGGSCAIGIFSGAGSTGTTSGTFPDSCVGTISRLSHGTAPAPDILGIILLDSDGQLITNKVGGTGKVFDELLTRNANYTLKISSPNIDSQLSFGKSQETQSYTCQSDATPKFKTSVTTVAPRSGCGFTGSCFSTTYYYLSPNGFTIGATQCNLP